MSEVKKDMSIFDIDETDAEVQKIFNNYCLACKAEEILEYRKWVNLIPIINWDKDWSVQALPPFSFATVRYAIYHIEHATKQSDYVSIFLDCGQLRPKHHKKRGWEIYPVTEKGENIKGEWPKWCDINNIGGGSGLLAIVREAMKVINLRD